MNIKEYKERKDKLRGDIESLIREFNREVDTVILSVDINIDLHRTVGNNPVIIDFQCGITTEIDQ